VRIPYKTISRPGTDFPTRNTCWNSQFLRSDSSNELRLLSSSVGESSSALGTTARQNFAASRSAHPLKKAVLGFASLFLRLVRALHRLPQMSGKVLSRHYTDWSRPLSTVSPSAARPLGFVSAFGQDLFDPFPVIALDFQGSVLNGPARATALLDVL
jgi:hypothetical protein